MLINYNLNAAITNESNSYKYKLLPFKCFVNTLNLTIDEKPFKKGDRFLNYFQKKYFSTD